MGSLCITRHRSEASRAGRFEITDAADDDATAVGDESLTMRRRRAASSARSRQTQHLRREWNEYIKWRERFAEVIDVTASNDDALTIGSQSLDRRSRLAAEEVKFIDRDRVEVLRVLREFVHVRNPNRRDAYIRVRHKFMRRISRVKRWLHHAHSLASLARMLNPPQQFRCLPREHRSADDF